MPLRLRNLAFWASVSLFAEVTAGELIGWTRFALGSDLRGPDFFSYYAMSLLMLRQGPSHAYDAASQKHFQELVTAQWQGHFILLPHLLPPWATLSLYPLGLLPYRGAYLAWGIAIIALVAAGIAILVRAADLQGRPAILSAVAAASSVPVTVDLLQGQSDALMIPALGACALYWVRGQPGRAGVFAALAMVKPQMILLLPVFFLVRRSWRALAGFAVTGSLLVAVSLAVFGVSACLQWLSVLAPWASAGSQDFPVDSQSQYSLRGLLQLLSLPAAVQLVVLALGLLLVAAVLGRSRADARLQLALAIAGSVALSAYQHAHDLALLVVPGLLLAGALPAVSRRVAGMVLLIGGWIALGLLILAPVVTAIAVVGLAAYLAFECLGVPARRAGEDPLPVPG